MTLYNNSYINTFDESVYINLLNDPKKLDKLKNTFVSRYNKDVKSEVRELLLKESLDHYVLRELINNSSFINTTQMFNYMTFLSNIYRENKLEFTTNIVFRDKNISDKIINTYFSKYKDIIFKNKLFFDETYDKIILKIKNNENINQNELNFISEYITNVRNPYLDGYKDFLSFVFGRMKDTNLKFSNQVVDAVLAYLPFFYGDGQVNVRYVIGNTDGGHDISGPAHSSFSANYIAFNKELFSDVNIKSIEDSKYERLKKGSDITFFMIVAFHEITHQLQSHNHKSNSYDNIGMGYIIKNIIYSSYSDYKKNHDSDEIEIMANEIGWSKCYDFYEEFYTGNNKEELLNNCIRNRNTSNIRRIFSYKKDNDNKIESYQDYDIRKLVSILKQDRSVLDKYPMLKKYFNTEGSILKTSYIYDSDIYTKTTGKEFINYFFNYGGINAVSKKIEDKSLNNEQVIHLINNTTYFILDIFDKIDSIDYVIKSENYGEYKTSYKLDDNLKIKCYLEGYNNYKKIKPLFDIISKYYPLQISFINQMSNWINKNIMKYSDILNNELSDNHIKK